MSYILLVDDEPEILNILEMTVNTVVSSPIKTALSGNKAWKIIQENGLPSIIISDFRMPDGDGLFLYARWLESMSEVPFVVCSGNPIEELRKIFPKATDIVKKPECFFTIEPILKKYFQPANPLPEYVNIPLDLLVRLGVVEVDVYIKLADDKHIKVVSKGDMFDSSDREKYQKKLISRLSITRQDAKKIIEKFEKFLKQKMDSSESSPTNIKAAKEALEITVAFSKALGWNEDTVRIAKATVDLTIKMVSKEPSWSSILSKAGTDSKYGHHIALISLLSCGIAHSIGWFSDSTKQKLVMAALIHDYFVDEEKYDDLEAALKDPIYRKHPIATAELVRTIKDLPTDVDNILLQHHENPLGTGFPRGLTSSHISPLAALFIICEELTLFCHDKKLSPELIQDFWILHPEYLAKEPFKKIALAMI